MSHHYIINREQLLVDLYKAYKDARKHKRSKTYQLQFEFNLEENLIKLCDELISRNYKPRPCICFIIHDPKMREVFASDFRDRIVHHLFYNYTHKLFERTFIYDSYSCIKNKGTHFGINRLKHHIKSESKGYSKMCYILKIDIKGYFMSINREKLLRICRNLLDKMQYKKSDVFGKRWTDLLDFEFIDYLLETIICADPIENCCMIGNISEWELLPREKSMYYAKDNCGLPIGNLSSQLFSNVYMNLFDQYVKRILKCNHYGRYVDDAFVVSCDLDFLKSVVPRISEFLKYDLGLKLNNNKTMIFNSEYGVEFLGAYLKPFRSYISNSSLKRINKTMMRNKCVLDNISQSAINSYLGVFSHYSSYTLRRVLFGYLYNLVSCGQFDKSWRKFIPFG